MNNLVVVESPTKARTLQKYLGSQYQIEATMGHIRDLPKSEFGVDIEHGFVPQYVIPRDKRKIVNNLKKAASLSKTLWLATDLDREGEAIAWHIIELLRNSQIQNSKFKIQNEDIKRVVFHEITEDAIKEAFQHPRGINQKLVEAQVARRILDRIVGYKLSPLLWQKVKRGLSAGRVQSVVLRLIVEREREITAFVPQEYWIIEAQLEGKSEKGEGNTFIAILIEKDGKKLSIKNKKEANGHVKNLEKADYKVAKIVQKEIRKYPAPPFTTSTLQQQSFHRLGFSARKTMMLAQNLYEQGLITYMRTDSLNLSGAAISAARVYIGKNFEPIYLPKIPRIYRAKSKLAQEAHEAIRPTDVRENGERIREKGLNKDNARLYDLIWKRFVACQMSEALIDQTTMDVKANSYLLRATGSVIKFEGWLKLYQISNIKYQKEEEQEDRKEKDQRLPELMEGEKLNLIQLLPSQHFTEAPPRYTEASLIKKLEELGIGRPSTYAPILSIVQERFYVEKEGRIFIPTLLGFAVCDFLVQNFSDIMDYKFTASLEDELDDIARGERQWVPTIRQFYTPFEKKLEQAEETSPKVKLAVEYAGKKCPHCEKDLIVRTGKFGKFLACSGFPECKYTESLEEKVNASCPQDGGEIVLRRTRKGKTFYGCKNWPGCKFASWTKPKNPP